jgi:hypothetical protein
LLFSFRASATMAPLGAVAPNTTPASAGYYRPSLRRGSPFKWVHSNDYIHVRVIPHKESGICCLYNHTLMSGHETPSLADHHRPSPRRGSPFKSIHSKYCIQKLVIHDKIGSNLIGSLTEPTDPLRMVFERASHGFDTAQAGPYPRLRLRPH